MMYNGTFGHSDVASCPICGKTRAADLTMCKCGADFMDTQDPFGYSMNNHQDAGWTTAAQPAGSPQLGNNDFRETRVGNSLVRVVGSLVPQVEVALAPNESVYFEHHILLWKHPNTNIGIKPLKGALKRMMAGMQIFVTEATGPGSIAFSRDDVGEIIPIHIRPGEEIHVREHQFVAATGSVDYSFFRVKGVANILFGGTGFWIDKFVAPQQPGLLLLHGYGNVYEVNLRPGEAIDVEPGGFLYKDASVQMQTNIQKMSSGFFGGFNLFMNRFIGPGRIGIQTMYVHLPTAE